MQRIAIIGGGAAGLMAAAKALEYGSQDLEIILFEGNPQLGTKVRISGGGRCNVTTGRTELSDVLSCYYRGKNFLKPSMYAFPPDQVRAFFEERGVPLKCEADMRVFPVSDDGDDIVGVFETLFRSDPRMRVFLREKVQTITKAGTHFSITSTHHTVEANAVILTTGGQAYRHTGSQGDGYTFAESLGHHITELAPSLHSFVCQETWFPDVAGISFQTVHLHCKGKEKHKATGPMIFTHKGISGPVTFALSSSSAFEPFDRAHPLTLHLDLLPDFHQEDLRTLLLNLQEKHPHSLLKNTSFPLPKALVEHFSKLLGTESLPLNAWSHKQFNKLILQIKDMTLQAISRGKGDEFVTAGGVECTEINKQTMESTICPGLFFAGEILNVDGITGGFNLQCAWATGAVAGKNAVQE